MVLLIVLEVIIHQCLFVSYRVRDSEPVGMLSVDIGEWFGHITVEWTCN